MKPACVHMCEGRERDRTASHCLCTEPSCAEREQEREREREGERGFELAGADMNMHIYKYSNECSPARWHVQRAGVGVRAKGGGVMGGCLATGA